MTTETIRTLFTTLLTGIGIFLVGVHLLTETVEQLSLPFIRKLFEKSAARKGRGVLIGASATALLQSSGVTTVLIVGFVNAGILSLHQATAMIMGANIGTTITAQLAMLSILPVSDYLQALTFVGIFAAIVGKKDSLKKGGRILAGLGTVFTGLSLMSGAIEPFSIQIQHVLECLQSPVLLLLFGAALTALVQSSSAVTSILISMSAAGLSIGTGRNEVLFLLLGTNIGSCMTALLSSLHAGTNAKRAGFIHLLFNTAGAVLFFIPLTLIPELSNLTLAGWFPEPAVQIAVFHTAFNVICTLLFLPVSHLFVRAASALIQDLPKMPEQRGRCRLESPSGC